MSAKFYKVTLIPPSPRTGLVSGDVICPLIFVFRRATFGDFIGRREELSCGLLTLPLFLILRTFCPALTRLLFLPTDLGKDLDLSFAIFLGSIIDFLEKFFLPFITIALFFISCLIFRDSFISTSILFPSSSHSESFSGSFA